MASCATNGQAYVASKTSGASSGAQWQSEPGHAYSTDKEYAASDDAAERAIVMDDIANESARDSADAQPNASAKRVAGVMGRKIAAFYDDAKAARARLVQEFNEVHRALGGTNLLTRSRWLNISTSFKRMFDTASADVARWAALYFNDPTKAWHDNRIVSAMEEQQSLIRGHQQHYDDAAAPIVTAANVIAKRSGLDTGEVLKQIGRYVNARHVAEANDHLMNVVWPGIIARERAKGNDANLLIIKQATDKIANLRQYIDDVNPPEDLYSCGYTNGQAKAIMDEVPNTIGATTEEINGIADKFVAMQDTLLQDRIKAGLVAPEQLAQFPQNWQFYTPFLRRSQNVSGFAGDTRVYDVNSVHEMQGMMGEPDDAFSTLQHTIRKTSVALGQQTLGRELYAAARVSRAQRRDAGIRAYDIREFNRALMSNDRGLRRWGERIEENGGIIVTMPKLDAKGNPTGDFGRYVMAFDPNWIDSRTGMTGDQMNAALGAAPKLASGLESIANMNSKYYTLFTHWNPAFGPVNGIRDFMERGFNMGNRTYYRPDGTAIHGHQIMGQYLLNAGRASAVLKGIFNGKMPDPNSSMGQYWQEYVELGLKQDFSRGRGASTLALENVSRGPIGEKFDEVLNAPGMKGVKQVVDGLGKSGAIVKQTFQNWNDYFNNIASFAHFMTLRNAGVAAKEAGRGVRNEMNLYNKGTVASYLRVLWPFVYPTLQSARAVSRTLGFGYDPRGYWQASKKGYATILAATGALMALKPLIAEALGKDDETGVDRIDMLSLSDISRGIPIGFGGNGDYVKMPVGFGILPSVITAVFGADRVERGLMSPGEYAFEVAFSLVKNMSPAQSPQFDASDKPFEFIMQTASPALLQPLMQLATNTGYFGQDIVGRTDENLPKAMQGRNTTPSIYHELANIIHKAPGNPDFAPEQLRALAGYWGGPLRLVRSFLETDSVQERAAEPNAREKMGMWLEGLGASILYGSVSNLSRSAYFKAWEEMRGDIKAAGVKLTNPNNKTHEDRISFIRKQLSDNGFDDAFINDYLTLDAAKKQIDQLNKGITDNIGPLWLNADDPENLKEAIVSLAEQKKAIYDDAVRNLNFYTGIRR